MALGFLQVSGWFASVPLGDTTGNGNDNCSNTQQQKQYANDDPCSSSSTTPARHRPQQEQETEHAHDKQKNTMLMMTTTMQSSSTSSSSMPVIRTNNKASVLYNRRANSLISDAPTCIIPPVVVADAPIKHQHNAQRHHQIKIHASQLARQSNNKVHAAVAHRRTQSNEERLAMFAELAATNKGDGQHQHLEESCFYYQEMLKIQRYSCTIYQDHDAHALEVAKTLTQLGDSLMRLCTASASTRNCNDCSDATAATRKQRSRSRMLREASNVMKEALSLQRRALGQNHLIVAGTLHSIGILACMRRNYDAASLAFGEEIQIRKNMYDSAASAILRNNHQGNGNSSCSAADTGMHVDVCSGEEEESMMDIGVLSVIMGLTMLKRREYGASYDAFQDALVFYRRAGLSSQHRYVQDVCRFLRQKRLFYTCVERFWETEGTV